MLLAGSTKHPSVLFGDTPPSSPHRHPALAQACERDRISSVHEWPLWCWCRFNGPALPFIWPSETSPPNRSLQIIEETNAKNKTKQNPPPASLGSTPLSCYMNTGASPHCPTALWPELKMGQHSPFLRQTLSSRSATIQ